MLRDNLQRGDEPGRHQLARVANNMFGAGSRFREQRVRAFSNNCVFHVAKCGSHGVSVSIIANSIDQRDAEPQVSKNRGADQCCW